MQFLKTILILIFATLISAAALPQDANTAIEANFTGIHTTQSADGNYTFSIYDEGKLESHIVVINDPGAPKLAINAFSASGAQLDSATGAAATGAAGFSTESFFCGKTCQILIFIGKYGKRAADFIACVGNKLPAPCWAGVFACAANVADPLGPFVCFATVVCGSPAIKACL